MNDDRTTYQLDTSQYQRPGAEWICGRAAEGLPCSMGPGVEGECGAVCTPYLEGERYYCGNASVLGGKCDEGPLPDGTCCQSPAQCAPSKLAGNWVCRRGMCMDGPLPDGTCCRPFGSCRPKRSIFARRKQVTWSVFALAVAALLMIIGGPARKQATSPGELASPHRLIEESCNACHTVGSGSAGEWIEAAFAPAVGKQQTELCLECHTELGNDASFAHSLSTGQLAQVTERIVAEGHASSEPWLLHVARIGSPSKDNQLACATCHHEHHGEQFDLKHMTDLQCQVCHTNAFESFVDVHPQFTNFPYQRRTRLYFDHAAHFGQHFQEFERTRMGEPLSHACSDCHETGPKEKLMLVKGFEQSCALCHEQQIQGDGSAGIVFFSLPAIDVPSLRAQGFGDIGHWPVTYPKHVEAFGSTSPLTELLLESHSDFADALQKLEGVDLSDLRDATPTELKQVQHYVWTLKGALHQLRQAGRRGFQQRLATLLRRSDTDTELNGSMLYDKLIEAQIRWLPDLEAELAAHVTNPTDQTNAGDDTQLQTEEAWIQPQAIDHDWVKSQRAHIAQIDVGWYLRDSDLSLRYRPVGHEDPWLAAWLEGTASKTGAPTKQRVFAELAHPSAPGHCMKCHTADRQSGGELKINWHAKDIASRKKSFTDFTHRPHLTGTDSKCQDCHLLKESSGVETAAETDRGIFRSEFIHADGTLNTLGDQLCGDFTAIEKSSCAKCHSKGLASQSCLTCHNYHIEGHE